MISFWGLFILYHGFFINEFRKINPPRPVDEDAKQRKRSQEVWLDRKDRWRSHGDGL